jgi:hypothetical protein
MNLIKFFIDEIGINLNINLNFLHPMQNLTFELNY